MAAKRRKPAAGTIASNSKPFNADTFLLNLWAVDAVLVKHGFWPISPWWRRELERFFRSGRFTFVLRVGRRGGKSATFCRVGVVLALYGTYRIPPGEVGVVAFVSVRRSDSSERLRSIKAILDALGFAYKPVEDGVELLDRPIVFKTYAASMAGVSGFTCIGALCDEVCKWLDLGSGANPASEVIGSLKPTLATQPHAPLFLCSSPMSTLDAHYKLFEKGDNDEQLTSEAPSWVASPIISEEQSHKREPDPRIWAREYAAIPQPSIGAAFEVEAIERAFDSEIRLPAKSKGPRYIVMDPSSGHADGWTWGVCGWDEIDYPKEGRTKRTLVFDVVDGVDGRFFKQIPADAIVKRVSDLAKQLGLTHVHADPHENYALRALFNLQGVTHVEHPWAGSAKPEAVAKLRRWFAEGRVWLPKHEKLKRELLAFEEKITASGEFTFAGRGKRHDDYVALLMTAAMAIGDQADVGGVNWNELGNLNATAEAWSRWGEGRGGAGEGRGF